MKRRPRREAESASLSFLDAISSGFGAIVLLLVIVKVAEPTVAEQRGTGLTNIAQTLADELPKLDQEQTSLGKQLADEEEKLARVERQLARLRPQAVDAEKKRQDSVLSARANAAIEGRLRAALQSLSEEMRRLQAQGAPRRERAVAGIPVDSEYIIFVIDTSGSMQMFAWPKVLQTLEGVLNAYPRVRGIQVMNDMGDLLFSQYAGQWIPDSPARRQAILERLRGWRPFSNSSPVEGITAAIRMFGDPSKRISIYVFGDDFTGSSVQAVLDQVARINPRGRDGRRMVRIHAVGFPTLYGIPQAAASAGAQRFSLLMQRLTAENGGAFVALDSAR